MNGTERVIVVGASLAGTRAAEALRTQGFAGEIALVCTEPSYPIADRPPLSKTYLLDDAAEPALVPQRMNAHLRVLTDRRATSLDAVARVVSLDDGARLDYDGLVVATGATPRRLGTSVPGNVHVLRDLADAERLRAALNGGRSVAVIGAGVLGCEVAAACRQKNLRTTLIDVASLPMTRVVGDVVGGWIADMHHAHGVELVMGKGVARLIGDPEVIGVELLDGQVVDSDVVVLALGATPEVGWLAGSGLVCEDGVLCDKYCFVEGTDQCVVAAGDVARWHHHLIGDYVRAEHWTNAVTQGQLAGHNLAVALAGGADFSAFAELPYFWSDQYDWQMKLVGVPSPQVSVVEGDRESGSFVVTFNDGDRLIGVLGVNAARALAMWRRQVTPAARVKGKIIDVDLVTASTRAQQP